MSKSESTKNKRGGFGGRARPTKYAKLICGLTTLSALVGIIIGFLTGNPLWVIIFILPAVIYEIYRTQGVSTKWASWMMLFIVVAQFFLIVFKVKWNFAEFLGQDAVYVGGQNVPLGDISILGPTLLAVTSLILIIRTAGVYTKWLAGTIFVTAFALIYILNPETFTELLRSTINQVL